MSFLEASLLDRARARSERATRLRVSLAALALVALALAGLSAVAFSQWRIADASLRVERAERLADLSVQESARGATPALLAADAYATMKTPRTAGAMLEQLMRLQMLRGAAIGSVGGEAFARRGRLLAATTSSSGVAPELVVFDALNLAAIAHGPLGLPRVTKFCASPDAAWLAATDGHSIFLYDGIERGPPQLTGSWGAGRVDAMACLARRRAVIVSGAVDDLRVLDFGTAAQRSLKNPPGERVAAIVASPFGRFAAVSSSGLGGSHVYFYDLRFPGNPPVLRTPCTPVCGAVAFSPDEQRAAWTDGEAIRSLVTSSPARIESTPCRCAAAAVVYGADGSGPHVLLGAGTAPVYDANTETYVTRGGRGIAEHSLDGAAAPALGMQKAPEWPGSFASVGSWLVLAGTRRLQVYDLTRYRSQLTTAGDVSRVVRVSDPGDGIHAVALNYRTGEVRIFAVRSTESVTGDFHAQSAAAIRGSFTDEPEIGYNPAEQTLTEAAADGITRYAMSGREIVRTPWSEIASAADLPTWYPAVPYLLSSRGSYVGLAPPQINQVPGAVTSTVALVSTNGGLVARFASTPYISIDQRYATGVLASDPDTAFGVYRLQRAERQPGVDLPETRMAALSPDAAMIAYATGTDSRTAAGVALFNVAANARVGPAIPGPQTAKSIENIAFSDDARYLLVTYDMEAARRALVVYSIDPADWERTLCLWAGAQMERTQRTTAEHGIQTPDACRRYAAEMAP